MRTTLVLLSIAALAGCRQATPPPSQASSQGQGEVVKYGVPVVAGPMDKVLLKDYTPKPSLVVPATQVDKARFPVIDVHTHSSMNGIKTPADVAAWLRTMDETGVATSVVFTDAIGPEFDRQVELLKPHGDRFIIFCSLDSRNIDAPDFPQRAVAELERCHRLGARGVGELIDKGWGMEGAVEADKKRPQARRMHPDDPRMDAFWDKCAELGMPVNIHVADHPSCWQPLGPEQERTPDFQTFNMVGKDVPSYGDLLAARDRMLAKHRRTTYIACHLGNQGNDLAALGKVLDANPNLLVDISARDYEVGRQPRFAAKFLARYKDRVLFGTDMGREKSMYQGWWRLLESDDEFLPGRIWWRQYGLALPAPVLELLYRGNAQRVFNRGKA